MTKNLFSVLGVKPGATEDEIKKSYRNLARKYHPDKNKDPGAEDIFKEISAAYDYLKSADRREIHEREVNKPKEETKKSSTKPTPGGTYSTSFSSTGNNDGKPYTGAYSKYSGSSGQTYTSPEEDFGFTFHSSSKGAGKSNAKSRKKQSKTKPQKPWNQQWDIPEEPWPAGFGGFETGFGANSTFSFAFKSFVDDLDAHFSMFFSGNSPFEFSSFHGGMDPFDDFFAGKVTRPQKKTPEPKKEKKEKRNVASEHGYAGGLDSHYMFSANQGQSSGMVEESSEEEEEPGFRFSSDSDDDDGYSEPRFKCSFCGKRLKLEALNAHEPSCERRQRKDPFDDENLYSGHFTKPKAQDWRDTHEELLKNIRRARRAAKQTRDDNDLEPVLCRHCGRSFSKSAADHHIPFCERWTKDHGTPLNPQSKSAGTGGPTKYQRAREYSKTVPKPRYRADTDSQTPRSDRGGTSFPDLNTGQTRETMDEPYVFSGAGLSSPRVPKPAPRTRVRTPKFNVQPTKEDMKFPTPKGPTTTGLGARGRERKPTMNVRFAT